MSGREELIARIERDGKERIAAIGFERENAVAAIRQRTAEQVRELEQTAAQSARLEAQQLVERAQSAARLKVRNARLAARWRVIDRVIEEAIRRIRGGTHYRKRLADLVNTYGGSGAVAVVSAEDAADLRTSGHRPEIGQVYAGVVIRLGQRDLNLTLDSLAAEVKDAEAGRISDVLFGSRTSEL